MFNTGNCSVPLVASIDGNGNNGNGFGDGGWAWWIIILLIFGLATFFGFVMAGSYSDLKIWASWCLINAILAVVAIVKSKKTE